MRFWIWLFAFSVSLVYGAYNLTWSLPAFNLHSTPDIGDRDTEPVIAMDPFGNAIAAWGRTTGRGVSEDIWACVYSHAARVWYPATKISTGGNAIHPQIVFDNTGKGIIFWEEGFPAQIALREVTINGFLPPEIEGYASCLHPSINHQRFLRIATHASGAMMAMWLELHEGIEQIHTSFRPVGEAWHYLGSLGTDTNVAFHTAPALAFGAPNECFAVWQNGPFIRSARYAGGMWQTPLVVGKGSEPSVGADEEGNAVIVWSQEGVVRSRRFSQGILLDHMLVSNADFLAQRPYLGVDEHSGTAVVVFERFDALNKFIAGSFLPKDATNWSSQVDISGPSYDATAAPQTGCPVLSMNSIGDGVVLWKEKTKEHIVVAGTGFSLGTWGLFSTLSLPSADAGFSTPAHDCAVAINNAGNVIALWPIGIHGNGPQIQAAIGSGLALMAPEPPAPKSLSVPEPSPYIGVPIIGVASGYQILHRFPGHGDLINILTWTPPREAVSFKIYRENLSSLIAITQETSFEDHQRIPRERVVYLITSVDAWGHESAPLTLIVNPLDL